MALLACVQAIHAHQLHVPRAVGFGDKVRVESCPTEEEKPGHRLVHDSSDVTQALELTKAYRLRTPLGLANGQDTLPGVGRAFDRDDIELVLAAMLGAVDLRTSYLGGGTPKGIGRGMLHRPLRRHPVVAWLWEHPERLGVSGAVVPRALRILHALLAAAEERGWRVEA
jgi:hypothetical protein